MPPKPFFSRLLDHRLGGLFLGICVALSVDLGTRTALLFKSAEEVAWNLSLAASFFWGLLFDLGAALWWTLPGVIFLTLLPARFFALRPFRFVAHVAVFLVIFLHLFGGVAEWFFWDEFGVRANFIAVDYLVYTTEVIGNIRESYPLPKIFAVLGLLSLALYIALARTGLISRWLDNASTGSRWRAASFWIAATFILGLGLHQESIPSFANNYNRELAKNGLWSFISAFRSNQLDYDRFYPTMPEDAAFKRVQAQLAVHAASPLADSRDLLRLIPAPRPGPELRPNVIQITVESLSADFLSVFNRASRLSPNLEAIARQSLTFENFYATGNRTDRGMEALSLSVPPTPGRSLVKRPDNEHLFTLGSVFRSKGYSTAFIYGGYGYFDNMNYFFGENGYRVIDRTVVEKKDITFANVWGACDEDLFRWTLREADAGHASGQPFHFFVMTTSNHRPYTFPEGKIDLPSKISGRSGAVKYTDFAIGEFIRTASTKPWFKNTIFVIVADHCASSAGRTELPIQNYHIPLFIYAPGGQLPTGPVKTLMSQVDYAPTLLGLLNWRYPSRFYGTDIFTLPAHQPGRAYIANYQKLGLYQNDQLAILKPVRQSLTLNYDANSHEMRPAYANPDLIDDTIAAYQTASWLFKNKRQQELTPAEQARFALP